MDFFTITDADKKLTIARNIVMREQEIHAYELNVINYQVILDSLPKDEWPAVISAYKETPIQNVPSDYHDLVNDYQFRERVRHLIATEKHEMNKSVKVYQALLTQIPAEELPDLLKAAQQV